MSIYVYDWSTVAAIVSLVGAVAIDIYRYVYGCSFVILFNKDVT